MAVKNIQLKNTLGGKKEIFKPINQNIVGMYHCGPTVYGYAHIGNMRSYVLADLLRRLFENSGYTVRQVINITDVGHLSGDGDNGEDKVESSARDKKISVDEIVDHYTSVFISDINELNILTGGTMFPKATEHIEEQISLIKKLEEKGFTYVTSDGVYFNTAKFPDYGKLGNIDVKHLMEGARVAVNDEKKNITDFALWKFSKKEDARLQEWQSPWGKGFPGWHIECSAMSMKYLGVTFDIHTGGIDHIPVHHNNEIAQSECGNGKPLANYWIHNEFIRVDGQKMSKSLKNDYRLHDLVVKGFHPLSLRYWFLMSRYSTPANFTLDALKDAERAFINLNLAYELELAKIEDDSNIEIEKLPDQKVVDLLDKIIDAVNDDLDTPKALSLIHEYLKIPNLSPEDKVFIIEKSNKYLGFLSKGPIFDINYINENNEDKEIANLIIERKKAREEKNWPKSDEIREKLSTLEVNTMDSPKGSKYLAIKKR